jgi:hypothetical protein
MLIRSEQVKILETVAKASFVTEMSDHLHSFAPKICEVVGVPGIRRIAEIAIQRAQGYGLTGRGPIRFFIELTCSLGDGVDTDPQLPWVAETLNDDSIPSDLLRADLLHKRMVIYLDLVAGPDNQFVTRAIETALSFNYHDTAPEGGSVQAMMAVMKRIHPQKYEFIGEDVAGAIVRNAADYVETCGLSAQKGATVLIAGLQFALGHRICHDPYYPWIGATLRDSRIVDGEQKLDRLATKLRTYGRHALDYLTNA